MLRDQAGTVTYHIFTKSVSYCNFLKTASHSETQPRKISFCAFQIRYTYDTLPSIESSNHINLLDLLASSCFLLVFHLRTCLRVGME